MNNIYTVAVIGGGASGLMFSTMLAEKQNIKILLFERGERLGKKLSATGNGQGNITNERAGVDGGYFSVLGNAGVAEDLVSKFGKESMIAFLENLGGLFSLDERGRVYPTGRQASAVTDLLRFRLAESKNVTVLLKQKVTALQRTGNAFTLESELDGEKKSYKADCVVLCTGGKAAKNFGTDGFGYSLAQSFGHTITPLYPSLVQLKTSVEYTKTLKGIRVNDALVKGVFENKTVCEVSGDVIFTDYGVSGDAIFKISAFLTDKIDSGKVKLYIDLLPEVSKEKLLFVLEKKQRFIKDKSELLCGVLNNQVGRAVMKYAGGDVAKAVCAVKAFPLDVKGTLGYDYAQVTKGGIPLLEVDETFQSKKVKDFYFAGEILDVDGECGGFNLQFAYTSAKVVADAIIKKSGGQV
ncbi:MAG: aminoacetone oxidase family FAD-binding enzyme [Clostridia bacterium]|nr:aminoacetone oxidase family FAD-binding enzyme [Clostridia bacterium]